MPCAAILKYSPKAGYDPWVVLLEFYASGEGIETQKAYMEQGLWGQITAHSRTSQYGQEVTGRLSVDEEEADKRRMQAMIEHIRSGEFAKDWALEQQTGEPVFGRVRQINLDHPMVKAEQELYKILGRRKD